MMMSISVISILLISTLSANVLLGFLVPITPYEFDVLLLDVDQDGNLVKNTVYDTSFQSDSTPFWGKITELTTGGYAIAGYHEIGSPAFNPEYRQLWVIRTDEDFNIVWNRTYGRTWEIRSITEMNDGNLAIGHYIEDYDPDNTIVRPSLFQILVIDNEGEHVREKSWYFGWLSGFSHVEEGGFILAEEIYDTPSTSPFSMTRIDTDLNIVWNKTYPSFATHTDIVNDMAGGFTMPLEPGVDGPIGIARFDNEGNEISRVFTDSTRFDQYLTLTQCGNGEYLAGGPGYIIRFDDEGNLLWEKDVDFYVHGIQELSPDRFVAFESAGVRENRWEFPGVYLEGFDAGGTTIWIRSVQAASYYVPDIIYNTGGGLTILGLVDPKHLASVLYEFNSETPSDFDIWLFDINQDGNIVQNATYDTNFRLSSVPFWGKMTELTNGGYAIAGYHEIDYADSDPDDRQLWVIRTDEDWNIVWNRTFGKTWEIRSITEMNDGNLAIGHYIEDYGYYYEDSKTGRTYHSPKDDSTFQILVIDDEGEHVREKIWHFGWLSGFSHVEEGGFILAHEIYGTPGGSPYWMARIDMNLSVVWNQTYPSFATHTDIVEDMAGGFTMPLEPGIDGPIGIVRLDDDGNEISRVFTTSEKAKANLWLTQCSNGDYLGWYHSYIIRFNIQGDILWEKNVTFYVHGIEELSPDRFVAFERAGIREMSWSNSGVHLECFDAGGTSIWNRSIQAAGFFVPDIISNSHGRLTILGMLDPNYLPSVLDGFSETDTGSVYYLASTQYMDSLLYSDAKFGKLAIVLKIESHEISHI
jgi:hypothetical protein